MNNAMAQQQLINAALMQQMAPGGAGGLQMNGAANLNSMLTNQWLGQGLMPYHSTGSMTTPQQQSIMTSRECSSNQLNNNRLYVAGMMPMTPTSLQQQQQQQAIQQQQQMMNAALMQQQQMAAGVPATALTASPSSAPPCTTLFVANLGAMVNEDEVKEVFGSFPGFCRLRLHNKNGSPVGFVEFQVCSNLFELHPYSGCPTSGNGIEQSSRIPTTIIGSWWYPY